MSKNSPGERTTIDEIRRLYSNRKLLRVWPEWSSPGIWAPRHIGATPVGKYMDFDEFKISDELEGRFNAWQDRFDAQDPLDLMAGVEKCGFDAEGLNLAMQLSKELGHSVVVEYEIAGINLLFDAGSCVAAFARPPAPADP